MKTAIYTRTSNINQTDKENILREQELKCKNYCTEANWEISSIIKETHSAKSFDRPEWKELINQIENNELEVDVIIVTGIDRLTRDINQALEMFNQLSKLNIRVFSLKDNSFIRFANLILANIDPSVDF